jgi:hypothetical protein
LGALRDRQGWGRGTNGARVTEKEPDRKDRASEPFVDPEFAEAFEETFIQHLNSPDTFPLICAKKGDWGELADYLETDRPLGNEARHFLAKVLRGDQKRPNRRVSTECAARKRLNNWFVVTELALKDGISERKAIEKLFPELQRESVQRGISKFKSECAGAVNYRKEDD